MESKHEKAVNGELALDVELFKKAYEKELKNPSLVKKGKAVIITMSDQEREQFVYEKIITMKEKDMKSAVKELDFETAAILRDEIGMLKQKMDK